jgi:hypothetical protein
MGNENGRADASVKKEIPKRIAVSSDTLFEAVIAGDGVFTEDSALFSQGAIFVTAVSRASDDEVSVASPVCSVVSPTAASAFPALFSTINNKRNGVFWSVDADPPLQDVDPFPTFSRSPDKAHNLPPTLKERSSVVAAVSALVSLGSGVMGMLAPLTQYSAHTASSGDSAESQ